METNLITVPTIDREEEESKMADVAGLCNLSLTISNQPDYENASKLLTSIKKRYKEIDAERKTITSPMDLAKKAVMSLFNRPLTLLKNAENQIKRTMIDYTTEQQRIAIEEQRKLQAIADKAAAEEKKRLEAKIARAEASGKSERVEELQEQKETIVPIIAPIVAPNIEAPKGISYRDKWTIEVVDFAKLPDSYKLPNQSALNKVAQATKGAIVIPGTKINNEKIIASRS